MLELVKQWSPSTFYQELLDRSPNILLSRIKVYMYSVELTDRPPCTTVTVLDDCTSLYAQTLENSSRTMAPSNRSLWGMLRRSEVSIPLSLLLASTMFTTRPGLLSAWDWRSLLNCVCVCGGGGIKWLFNYEGVCLCVYVCGGEWLKATAQLQGCVGSWNTHAQLWGCTYVCLCVVWVYRGSLLGYVNAQEDKYQVTVLA